MDRGAPFLLLVLVSSFRFYIILAPLKKKNDPDDKKKIQEGVFY